MGLHALYKYQCSIDLFGGLHDQRISRVSFFSAEYAMQFIKAPGTAIEGQLDMITIILILHTHTVCGQMWSGCE